MRKEVLFLLSLVGILILLTISNRGQIEVYGRVSSVRNLNEVKIILLEDFEKEIVLFTSDIIIINNGDEIKVRGTRGEYKGKEQIVADKIWKVKY